MGVLVDLSLSLCLCECVSLPASVCLFVCLSPLASQAANYVTQDVPQTPSHRPTSVSQGLGV